MELLQELLEINDENTLLEGIDFQLFEDLGNLKKIDPKLFKIFIKPPARWSNDEKKARPVRGALGQNSSIEEYTETHQDRAWDKLTDAKAKALILKYDGDQIFAVIKATPASGYGSRATAATYMFILNPSYFEKIVGKDAYNDAVGGVKKVASRVGLNVRLEPTEFEAGRATSGIETGTVGKIKKIMKLVYDTAKKNKVDLKTMIVNVDEERAKKSEARAKGREGSLPLPTGNKIAIGPNKYSTYEDIASRFFKNLKTDLKGRLESFKAGKAKGFDNPNDLLKGLIDEGYFDKLKFMGFTYRLADERINFRGLRGDKFYGESYILYKIQQGTPELEKAQEDWKKIRDELGGFPSGEEAQAKYYETRKKVLPPEDLKIILKLDGGVITPDRIQIGKDDPFSF